jgi:hypothetical protein
VKGYIKTSRGTRGGPFEYTCDNRPTRQREKTSEYYKTLFSIPGQCFLELPPPDSDVLDTWDDIHRVVSIPKPSDAGTTIIRNLTTTR